MVEGCAIGERTGRRNSQTMGENFEKEHTECIEERESRVCNMLQKHMAEMRQDILELVNSRVDDMVSEITQKMDSEIPVAAKHLVESEIYSNRTKPTRKNGLATKQFLHRNSLLTDMYEIKHIRTIYNLMVSTLIILLIHTAVYDIRHTGSPNLGMNTIRLGFGQLPIVLCVWPLMKSSALAVYAAFNCWATRRSQYPPASPARKVWDYGWLLSLILYQTLLLVLPTKVVLKYDLPFASSMIVLMEQTRLMMKVHAFVRSVTPRFLSYKPHSETPVPQVPGFSKYLYFMFAPTLIYQDSYPRLKKTRWNVVLTNFAEVLTTIVFVALLYERLLYPNYGNFGKEPMELSAIMLNILSSMLPGILLLLCGFYLLLHCWMNAFAELLRFADRMFYQDWWNSSSFGAYYRTWNVVVHDWLYNYVYRDMYEIVTPGNKCLSVCTVFAISAIFHEYILCFTSRFFYPVMLLMFGGIGLVFLFLIKKAGNVFVWFSLSSGFGTMVSLYCMEYYARLNCSPVLDGFWDLVIPRTWTCIFASVEH